MSYLYKNWSYICPFMTIAFVIFLLIQEPMSSLNFWIWMQFPIYLIHQYEEHAWPGGFKNFVNEVIFERKKGEDFPLNMERVFWINILIVWGMFPLCGILAQFGLIVFGIMMTFFALFNASLHVLIGIILRRYNPGLGVSLFLNFPFGIYTLYLACQEGSLTLRSIVLGLGVAFLGHLIMFLLVFYWNHIPLEPKKKGLKKNKIQ